MSVTNQQILNAINAQTGRMEEMDEKVTELCVMLARMEQWRNDHEKRTNGLEKAINTLRTRINAQGAIVGAGEILVAAIAFLRGSS